MATMWQWRSLIRELTFGRNEPWLGGVDTMPPGYEDDPEAVALARFAIAEHNRNTNAAVEFERLLKVRQQMVAGCMHYFTIEGREGGARKLYKAKVLQRAWEKSRQYGPGLEDFKPLGNNTFYNRLRHFHVFKLLPELFED